jgi:hypothetical protein
MAGAKTFDSQVTVLADKTADQIAKYMSTYAAQEGWIPAENAHQPRVITPADMAAAKAPPAPFAAAPPAVPPPYEPETE